jgi:hypothetical protein
MEPTRKLGMNPCAHDSVKRRTWTYIVPSNVTYCCRYHNTLHVDIIYVNDIKMMHTFNIKTKLFLFFQTFDFERTR